MLLFKGMTHQILEGSSQENSEEPQPILHSKSASSKVSDVKVLCTTCHEYTEGGKK